MSTLSEHVSLSITQDSVGIARAGFGIPLILSCNATFSERVRFYSDLPGLVTDGFVTTSPEYLAVQAILSQNPHPEQVAIGRTVGKPTLAYRLDISSVAVGTAYTVSVKGQGVTTTDVTYTTLADITFTAANATELFTSAAHGMVTGAGPFRVSNSGGALPAGLAVDTDYWVIADVVNGVADPVNTFQLATSKANALAGTELLITTDGTGTQTIRRNQNDVICAQLVQGLNAVVGNNYLAAQVTGAAETDYVTVTGDAAGSWFSLAVGSVALIKSEMTHAEPSPTLATDLDAIQLENGTWYSLVSLYNSDAYVKAVAAWVESTDAPKIYGVDLSNSETATLAAGGSDTAQDLETLAYTRTFMAYHPSPADMLAAGWMGKVLPLSPGSETWKFKTPAGVNPVTTTSTHRTNLRAKSVNTLQTVAGRNITWEGVMADGGFIDTVRGLDWLEDDMTKAVFGVLANAAKVPMTNAGISLIEKEIYASLKRAFRAGIIDSDYTVTVPKVLDITVTNRGLRILPDVKFSCRLQGAIHRVIVSGVVSV